MVIGRTAKEKSDLNFEVAEKLSEGLTVNNKMTSTRETASELFQRLGLEGKTTKDSSNAYENLLEYPLVKAPTNFDYVVQHVQHQSKFDRSLDNPAYTTLSQFGDSREEIVGTLMGMEYKDFKGVYMGLKPYTSKADDVFPFPLDEEATRQKIFFFARVFDGGKLIDDICSDSKYQIPDPDEDETHQMFTTEGTYRCIIF